MVAPGTPGRSRKAELAGVVFVCVLLLSLSQLAIESQFAFGFNQSPNNRNVSVDTQVNVTGAVPEVLATIFPTSITLNAGSLTEIACNLTIRDYNGFADISFVQAALFSATQSSYGAADDNNTHYSNSSCQPISGQQSGVNANYTCTFILNYYAINSTWNCTAVVNDTLNLRSNGTNSSIVNALFALNVTPLIDYGNMTMGDTSGNVEANVTNLGNRAINITVRGYGRNLSDGYGFFCDQGNLTVDLQHFAANSTAAYNEKQTLASAYGQIGGLSVPKAVNATATLNSTYWQLYLNPTQNAFGICNGTIVFQANNAG